jgi:hypothetical protein
MKIALRPALSARSNAGVAEESPVHRLGGWTPTPRLVGVTILTGLVAAFLAYMVVNVPIVAPRMSRAEAVRHWSVAVMGALVVLTYVLVVAGVALRQRGSRPLFAAPASSGPPAVAGARPVIPRSLSFERVPATAVAACTLVSAAGLAIAAIGGYPLWVAGLALLTPWLPLVALEASGKYERHGVFAAFALLVVLQVAHMGEHTMQVGQLLASGGNLATSHGVFGQLDFELVHFFTDTALWLTLGLLLMAFYSGNRWLWVAFAAASLHQVEHLYLFWLYNFHGALYDHGGFAGIMGEGGMVGSPLDRPYLHFTYNFIVVVPMVIALWDQARRVDGFER